MLNCQWFVIILIVLDEFLHYLLFYLSISNILHNLIQYIEKSAIIFCNYMSEIDKLFQHHLAPCARCYEDFSGFGVNKQRTLAYCLFQERRKLELWTRIFTLFITKHTIEFSQANLYALVYHFETVNLIVSFLFSAWWDELGAVVMRFLYHLTDFGR